MTRWMCVSVSCGKKAQEGTNRGDELVSQSTGARSTRSYRIWKGLHTYHAIDQGDNVVMSDAFQDVDLACKVLQ